MGTKHYDSKGRKLREPKIAIGMALTPHIFGDFFAHYTTLGVPPDWNVITCRGAYVQDAHQRIAEQFMKTDCTHLLSLEEDHVFPVDLVQRALDWAKDPEARIVGGMYFLKRIPPLPVGFHVNEENEVRLFSEKETVYYIANPAIYEVGIIGMGCTLISREIFEAWPKGEPYYVTPSNYGDETGRIMSDDSFFCLKARQLGFKTYLDSTCQVKHMAVIPIGHEQYIASLAQEVRRRQEAGEKPENTERQILTPSKLEVIRKSASQLEIVKR